HESPDLYGTSFTEISVIFFNHSSEFKNLILYFFISIDSLLMLILLVKSISFSTSDFSSILALSFSYLSNTICPSLDIIKVKSL
ncbi:hypothetical protein, partial [Bacillus altitudinis]|uniref:hypothetical protein n=1 Tax=Bacillus altitudinis TaxID=293387 RepID=UPI0024B98A0B